MSVPSKFITEKSFGWATHRYTCEKGHSMETLGTWTVMKVRALEFNYCLVCFGEWAQSQWPLKCEEIDSSAAAMIANNEKSKADNAERSRLARAGFTSEGINDIMRSKTWES